MIELKALCGVLDSLGIPWANQRFADGEEPAPPFICLVAGYNEAAYADNGTYRGTATTRPRNAYAMRSKPQSARSC